MIRLRADLFSESLEMGTSLVALMPQAASGIGMQGATAGGGDGVPVLYLLHGLSDDCTIWERRTAIERYATEHGIAVVMPEVRRSFYVDEAVGERYWTWISEELPGILARTLRISTAREDTFVGGLSMGGFGALKLALNHPGRFAAAASLSGALLPQELDLDGAFGHLGQRVWAGADLTGTEDDLIALLGRHPAGELPALFLDCGTEDALLPSNERFAEAAESRGVDLQARFRPGEHTWDFWDRGIQDVLAWLPIRR